MNKSNFHANYFCIAPSRITRVMQKVGLNIIVKERFLELIPF